MTPPSHALSRRTVLRGAAAGAAAVVVALRPFDEAVASAPASTGVFGYGVASGDPTADAVVIWTRATPPTSGGAVATPGSGLGAPARGALGAGRRQRLPPRRPARDGSAPVPTATTPSRWTSTGLAAYTRYWYRFVAAGETSPVGRTQTAPDDRRPDARPALRAGVVQQLHRRLLRRPTAASPGAPTSTSCCTSATTSTSTATAPTATARTASSGSATRSPPPRPSTCAATACGTPCTRRTPISQAAHRTPPVDHDLRRPRGRQQRLGDRGREPHARHRGRVRAAPRARPTRPTWSGCRSACPSRSGAPSRAPGSSSGSRSARSPTCPCSRPGRTAAGRSTSRRSRPPAAASSRPADPAVRRPAGRPDAAPARARAARLAQGPRSPAAPALAPRRQPGHRSRRSASPVRLLGAPAIPVLLNSDQWDGYQADQADLLGHLGGPARRRRRHRRAHRRHPLLVGDGPAGRLPDGRPPAPTTPRPGWSSCCPSVTSDGFYEMAFAAALAGQPPEAVVGADQASDGRGPGPEPVGEVPRRRRVTATSSSTSRPARVQADFYLTPTPTTARAGPSGRAHDHARLRRELGDDGGLAPRRPRHPRPG